MDIYKSVYKNKVVVIAGLADRMKEGLEKLIEAGASVERLSLDLVQKERDLAVASAKADKVTSISIFSSRFFNSVNPSKVLQTVSVKADAANKVKQSVQIQKDASQAIRNTIAAEKAVAEKMLEEARPLLENAENALKTIQASAIATVRKLAKPPFLVMKIMDCVLLLFQKRMDPVIFDTDKQFCKPSWGEALKVCFLRYKHVSSTNGQIADDEQHFFSGKLAEL